MVELTDELIPGCDRDLVKPLHDRIAERYENIFLNTRVTRIEAESDGLRAHFEAIDTVEGDLRFPSASPASD